MVVADEAEAAVVSIIHQEGQAMLKQNYKEQFFLNIISWTLSVFSFHHSAIRSSIHCPCQTRHVPGTGQDHPENWTLKMTEDCLCQFPHKKEEKRVAVYTTITIHIFCPLLLLLLLAYTATRLIMWLLHFLYHHWHSYSSELPKCSMMGSNKCSGWTRWRLSNSPFGWTMK